MESFFSGKASKAAAIILLMLLPRLVLDIIFGYDYGSGAILGAFLTVIFVRKYNTAAFDKIKENGRNTKLSAIGASAVTVFSLQYVFWFLSVKTGELAPNDNWLSYQNIISPVVIAPVTEEITFRWALTEICIDKNTNKLKKIVFLIWSLIFWNFIHTKSLTSINISVLLLGLLFYMIYFRTGNLLYCIFAHMFANTAFVVFTSPLQRVFMSLQDNYALFAADVIILILSIIFTIKLVNKKSDKDCENCLGR
ncbi:MAG: CPBP family intramembrane metalloprotease [Oscillospiraceae bacterium]|nr:CPBP family intramembrane metalloprotease [Oscillospiraceae bacterium]